MKIYINIIGFGEFEGTQITARVVDLSDTECIVEILMQRTETWEPKRIRFSILSGKPFGREEDKSGFRLPD